MQKIGRYIHLSMLKIGKLFHNIANHVKHATRAITCAFQILV